MLEITPTLTDKEIQKRMNKQNEKDVKTLENIEKKEKIIRKSRKIKKQKVIGKQNYINQETGEIIETTVIEKKVEQDFGWNKVWLSDLLNVIELVGSKKLKIVKYILNEMNTNNNIVFFTQRGLSKKLELSLGVINETIKILVESDFMKKIQNGVYQINPDILVKGNTSKRLNLLVKYEQINKEEE